MSIAYAPVDQPARETTAGGATALRSYPSYVGGQELPASSWVYVVSSRALMDDAFATLTAKRRLERGLLDEADAPSGIIGRVANSGPDTIAAATEAAAAAVRYWAPRDLEARVHALGAAIHDRLVDHADGIVDVLVTEGHPVALARWQVSGMLECFGAKSTAFYADQMQRQYVDGPRRLIVRRRPDGVVCVNPPQNAPLSSALLGVTAVMAGNALVVRAPRSAPLGVMYVMREIVAPALAAVGAPPGVLNVVCADPAPTLSVWLASPHVDDIMYFGSSENGLRFQERCVAAGKKPILELAGNDVVVVWRDADLALTADALVESFYGSGQLCMIPNQVVAHPDIADELTALLVDRAGLIRPGYAEDEDVLLTPVRRREKFFDCLDDAVAKGASVVCGGHAVRLDGTADETGMFLEPTVVRIDGLAHAREVAAVRDETFFPLLPVIVPERAADSSLLNEMVAFVNSNAYGLRNSVWAGDPMVVDRFVAAIDNGGLLKINDSHIGFLPYLPTHGGTGLTGGVFGEANYPIIRTSHIQGVSVAERVHPRDAVFGGWQRLCRPSAASDD